MSESVLQNEKSFGFDAFWLKIIAAVAMLCDHVAYVFLDGNYAMRAFGRLAFPIFAFFIAQGYLYTRDVEKIRVAPFYFCTHSAGSICLGIWSFVFCTQCNIDTVSGTCVYMGV